jgi:hypothetical protein
VTPAYDPVKKRRRMAASTGVPCEYTKPKFEICKACLHPRSRRYCDATVAMREPAATCTHETARCCPRQKHFAVPDFFLQGRDGKTAGDTGEKRQWTLGQA